MNVGMRFIYFVYLVIFRVNAWVYIWGLFPVLIKELYVVAAMGDLEKNGKNWLTDCGKKLTTGESGFLIQSLRSCGLPSSHVITYERACSTRQYGQSSIFLVLSSPKEKKPCIRITSMGEIQAWVIQEREDKKAYICPVVGKSLVSMRDQEQARVLHYISFYH